MKKRSWRFNTSGSRSYVICLVSITALAALSMSVASNSATSSKRRERVGLNLGQMVDVRVTYAGEPNLVAAVQSGSARGRALTSADLDRDGAPDLVAGYERNGTGIVTVQRGNTDAFAPRDRSVFELMQKGYNPDSLLPMADTYAVPEPVDFLQVGDFNDDTRKDVLLAARGGGLYLLAGDGKGGLLEPERITLPGTVTALAAGEFNVADGRTDVAVGITGPDGPALLIFQGTTQTLHSVPLGFHLSSEATAIQLGAVDDDPFLDVSVAVGRQIWNIHGWGPGEPPKLRSRVERIDAGFEVRGLAVGYFIWNRDGAAQIAALGDDGTIRILQRGTPDRRPFAEDEIAARAASRMRQTRESFQVGSPQSWKVDRAERWTPAQDLARGGALRAGSASQNLFVRAHISFGETDDLLVLEEDGRRLEAVRQVESNDRAQAEALSIASDLSRVSEDLTDEPAAVVALPQKLNGERNLVVLNAQSASFTMVQLAPTFTITVDRNDDPSGAGLTAASACTGAAGDCSLRGAVEFANLPAHAGTEIILPAGTYTLNINGAGGCVIESATTGNTIGDLEINNSTTIMGAGSASTIIRQLGNGGGGFTGDRVMCLNVPIAPNIDYTFSGLTVTGGRESSGIGGAGIVGGAKDNTLSLTDVTISNNRDTALANYSGGGLSITGGSVTITNCLIGGTNPPGTDRSDVTLANSAGPEPPVDPSGGPGGGIGYSPGDPNGATPSVGTLTITGTTVQHNTAGSTASGGGGADLYTHNLGSGSVSISTSTFANNQALGLNGKGSGGAIIVESIATTVDSTSFTSNTATNRGGGIYVAGGSLLLDGTSPSVTFTGNSATKGASSVGANSTVTVSGTNTIIGGSVEVATNGIWTNNSGSSLSPTDFSILGGTLNCNNSTMNVSGNFVINHEATKGGMLNADTGTINMQGNLDVVLSNGGSGALGQFNAGTGTINFNGSSAQSITNTSSITFNNLTVSNATQPLTANNSFVVGGSLNISGANAIFGPAAAAVISGAGTLTGTGTARVTRTAATPDFLTQYTISNKTLTNLTVDYSGSGNQTVNNTPAYGHLRISGTGTKTLQGATTASGSVTIAAAALDVSASNFALNVGGNWTNNVGGMGFNARSGTVTFNASSGTQTLTGNTTFFDLTLNNSGATAAFGSTSTTISHNLTASGGTMNGGTSTITFTGNPGAIGGANVKNFNNLVINNAAVISNTTGGNTTIRKDFTNNGTFTQGAGLTTTFDATNATHNLAGGGTTTFGNVTINGSTTVDAGSHNFSAAGANFTVTGTFTGNTGTVTFNGAAAQSILGTGSKNFGGLTINNPNGVTVNNVASTVDAAVQGALTLTTDLTIAAGAILQQAGVSSGPGDATGTVRRTDLDNSARAFGNPNVTIAIDAGTAPNPMDVTLAKSVPPDFTTSVDRTYTLTPTGGSGIAATLKLHYLTGELNGNTESKLALWRKDSGTWVAQGRTGAVDTANKAVTLTGVSSFSDWTLAEVEPPTISKAFATSSVCLNVNTTLTFTINNPNSTTPLNGVAFTDNLPAGLVVADNPNVVGACGGMVSAAAGSSTISLSGGTIAVSGNCTISVDVKGTSPGAKNNTTDPVSSIAGGTGTTSNTATLTVLPLPSCSVTGADAVCAASTGNTFTAPAGGTLTYDWSISGDGSIVGSTTSQAVNVTAGAAGSFTLMLTVTDTATTCGSTCSKTVTVNANPATPTISTSNVQMVNVTGASGTFTLTFNGQTTAALPFNATATQVQSALDALSSVGGVGGSATVTQAGSVYLVTFGGTLSGPQSLMTGSGSGGATVTVNFGVCSGSTGNQASGPAGASSYAWSISNGTITSATNIQTITYTAGASGSVTLNLTVTNAFGCSASNSEMLTINANPSTPPISTPNVQMVTVSGASGTFTLTFNGQTTSPLAFNTTAAQVESALNALPSIGGVGGSVTVTQASTVFVVMFGGTLSGPQPRMSGIGSGGAAVAVSFGVCSGSTGNEASGPAGADSYAWSITNGTITSETDTQTITYTAGASGSVTLNLTVTNDFGCGASNSETVTINANPATPTITPTSTEVCATSPGNQASGPAGATTYSWSISNGTITSATDIQTITYTAGGSGSVTLSLMVTNAFGCSASNSADVTIVICCTVTCASNITTSTDAGLCTADVTYSQPAVSGTCGTVTCSPASGSTFAKGVTTVTCTSSVGPTCSFTVTVNDNEAPVLTPCPSNITRSTDADLCTAVVNYTPPTATDNCPPTNPTVTCTPASGTVFAKGVTTVTCSTSDAAGNPASCSFTVTVNDNQAPTLMNCPVNMTKSNDAGQCSAVVTYTDPTATDNCPGVGTPACSPPSGSSFPKGVTTVTCSVSDAATPPNTSTCSFTVTVNDTEAPLITCPGNITAGTDPNLCSAVVTFAVNATDNCPGMTLVSTPASGTAFPKGVTTVNSTATDTSGNTASCSFTVTVNDTQPPTVTCPGNITTSTALNQCLAVVTYNVGVTDNCPSATVSVLPPSGSTFPKGVTTVMAVATDTSGNQSSCSFTVTVVDTQAPTMTCPANITTMPEDQIGSCVEVAYPDPVVTDNCPGATSVCSPPSGTCFPLGVTTVGCTATDASGNTATCSFVVVIFDTCIQDDSSSSTVLLWNSLTGDYVFCCKGTSYAGRGTVAHSGNIFTLNHTGSGRRVRGTVDKGTKRGSGYLQVPIGVTKCSITDRDIGNNTCACSASP